MRKQLCVATAFVILFVVASPLAAANQFYVGIKGGLMKPDAGGYDDAVNAAVLLGFEFLDLDVGSIAIEGEYTETISEGDATFGGIRGDWDIETYAIYGVFRTRGTLFFKGKIGYLHEDVSSTVGGFGATGSDSGLSLGIGGGLRIGYYGSVELEYTIIEEDVGFLSLGFNYYF